MAERGVSGAEEGMSLCLLHLGEQRFGIATSEVREVLGRRVLQRVPLAPGFVAGIAPYRGEVLTTVSLRALLGMEEEHTGAAVAGGCVLVLASGDEDGRFGLAVDAVGGVLTVPEDRLTGNPPMLHARCEALYDGAYRMDTGLLVRLRPERLRPRWLAESGLFGGK